MAPALPTSWQRVAIKKVYHGLFDGPHATPSPSDKGPIFLGIGNITDDGHLDFSKVRHISEADYPRWTRRVTPQPGDIVFTYEATLNRYAIIPSNFRGCLGRRLALIQPNNKRVDTRFLHFLFFGEDWRTTIEANKLAGATVDRVPLTNFPDFPINLPPLSIQRRIASILSAYDDLIENNTRRIAILEEMGRRLYEEWFIHFRFPGRDTEKWEGDLPEGWHHCNLEDVCDRITDGAHKSPSSVVHGKPMASVKDMHEWGLDLENCRRISEIDYESLVRNNCKPGINDILIAKDGANLNKHTFLVTEDKEIVLLSSIAIFSPSERIVPEFLVSQLKDTRVSDSIRNMQSGAAIPRIVLRDFKKLSILLPSMAYQEKWQEVMGPIASLCRLLVRRNANFRAQRDLLLPKLVSGEIDVSEIPLPNEANEAA